MDKGEGATARDKCAVSYGMDEGEAATTGDIRAAATSSTTSTKGSVPKPVLPSPHGPRDRGAVLALLPD